MLSRLSWDWTAEVDAAHNMHNGRGMPGHALPQGQDHLGMDIGGTAAHKVPTGRLGTYHCHVLCTL